MSTSPIVIRRLAVATGFALIAACAPVQAPIAPPPPPPPPPPVAVVETVPYRPVPPPQASYVMTIPARDSSGQRITINSNLGSNETIWHFRSGWNVAALNCTRPEHASITDAYRAFLTRYARGLTAANDALDRTYRTRTGSTRAGLLAREQHMTSVYNYFASPAARAEFCDAAQAVADEMTAAPPTDLAAFAAQGLARYEQAFDRFYTAFEEYESAAAAWDARYGAQYGPSQPGWVAVHGTGAAANSLSSLTTGTVVDPLSGADIPLVPVDEGTISTPVLQPLPSTPTP